MYCNLAPTGYSLEFAGLLLLLTASCLYYTTTLCDLQTPDGEYGTYSGDEGARTPDLDSAIVALSQLSYIPVA